MYVCMYVCMYVYSIRCFPIVSLCSAHTDIAQVRSSSPFLVVILNYVRHLSVLHQIAILVLQIHTSAIF